jgi:hypothetical protein
VTLDARLATRQLSQTRVQFLGGMASLHDRIARYAEAERVTPGEYIVGHDATIVCHEPASVQAHGFQSFQRWGL